MVYVWAIQQSVSHSALDQASLTKLFDLAECCLSHLAQATASNSPSRRYSLILQELRAEAKRKTARRHVDPLLTNSNTNLLSVDGLINPERDLDSLLSTDGLEPIFGSPIGTAMSDMSSFFDNWQTTDWLDLDCSAFVDFGNISVD